jgi:hypothetical protein
VENRGRAAAVKMTIAQGALPTPGRVVTPGRGRASSPSPSDRSKERRGEVGVATGVAVGEILPFGSPPLRPRSPNVVRDVDRGDPLVSPPRRARRGSFAEGKGAPLVARVPANLAHLQLGTSASEQEPSNLPHKLEAGGSFKARRPRRLTSLGHGEKSSDPFPASTTGAGDHTLPPLASSGPSTSPQRSRADSDAQRKGGALTANGSVAAAAAAAAAASAAASAAVKDLFPQHRRIHAIAADSLAPIDSKDLTHGGGLSKPIAPFKPRPLPSVGGSGRRNVKGLGSLGLHGKAHPHVSDDSVAVITGALDAAGLEPFIPTPQIVNKWAELLLQQDAPPDEVSRWQQEFNALEGRRAKRGGTCGGAFRGRRRASVEEQQSDTTAQACSFDFVAERSSLHSPPLLLDLHRIEEFGAGAMSDPAAAASTASAAAMTAAFLAAACDDSEELLVREARSNSACADRVEQEGQADDADGVEHVARPEVSGARQRLDSPPLFHSSIRLPSPPLRLGEEVDFSHDSMGVFGAGLADVAEESEDVADWWYGAISGEEGAEGEEDLLSLVYDPVLMCYYERTTGRYFQLKDGTQA